MKLTDLDESLSLIIEILKQYTSRGNDYYNSIKGIMDDCYSLQDMVREDMRHEQ